VADLHFVGTVAAALKALLADRLHGTKVLPLTSVVRAHFFPFRLALLFFFVLAAIPGSLLLNTMTTEEISFAAL
jgi:hypothetical protein